MLKVSLKRCWVAKGYATVLKEEGDKDGNKDKEEGLKGGGQEDVHGVDMKRKFNGK